MQYPSFYMFDSLRSDIWAIRQSTLQAIVDYCEAYPQANERGLPIEAEQAVARALSTSPQPSRGGAVAVIPIRGIISQGGGFFGVSTDEIGAQFQAVLAADEVGAIVFDINSPGGTVYGVSELADEIYAARGRKPIVAAVNSLAASAAYWIASAADEIAITPSGEAGSIGVYATHMDMSKMLETEGVKITLISAGKYKTEGNPFEALSDPARAAIQERVDYSYEMFAGGVARNRGALMSAVMGGFGEGRVLKSEDALAQGLVDRIEPFKSTLQRLLTANDKQPQLTARRALSVAHAMNEMDLW